MNNALEQYRLEIDAIDDAILALLEKRWQLVSAISDYKLAHQLSTYDPTREAQLMARLKAQIQEPSHVEALEAIFLTILDHSKRLQQK